MTSGWQARPVSEFKDVALRDLLGLHAGIMDELRRRGVPDVGGEELPEAPLGAHGGGVYADFDGA